MPELPSIVSTILLVVVSGSTCGCWLYLSLPTLTRRFATCNTWVAWIALFAAAVTTLNGFFEFGWWSLLNVAISIWLAWQLTGIAARRIRSQPPQKIYVVFFRTEPPIYGRNLW